MRLFRFSVEDEKCPGCNWRVGQLYVLAGTEGEARKVFDEGCGLWQTALQTCCVKRTI